MGLVESPAQSPRRTGRYLTPANILTARTLGTGGFEFLVFKDHTFANTILLENQRRDYYYFLHRH
jgi:hypothetical protein